METKESTNIKPEKIEIEQTSNEKQHSAESAYTCNICLMVFKYPAMILHHVKTVHNIRPFKCDHCSLSFNKRGILKRHIEKGHNIKKPKLKSVLLKLIKSLYQKYVTVLYGFPCGSTQGEAKGGIEETFEAGGEQDGFKAL